MDAIVFDWDGTLIDSLPAIFEANLQVLAEYGVPFDDQRYVGDVPDDMRMARAVGAVGIGIESSIGTRDDLVPAGATAVYPTVAAFVDELLGASDAEVARRGAA